MFIEHNDAQLHTLSFGSGPTTLLALGGWAGSQELWAAPFGYLSADWQTVSYDHRGTGATICRVESISFEAMVDDVFAVMEALGIERCVLAGESAGASVAIQAALREPGRITGLVLVDALYYQPGDAETSPFMAGLKNHYEATLDAFVNLCVPDESAVAIRRWGRQILARCEQAAAIRLYEGMFDVDLRAQLSQIMQPALIIHGEDDQVVPVASSQWMASQIPNSQLHLIPDAGHVPTMTHPSAIADAIRQYF